MEPTSNRPYKEERDLGKRPLWQWVVLYVIIGGLLYGVVYYFMSAEAETGMY